MAFTSASILTMVNARLNRLETDIDDKLIDTLQNLASRGDFIESTATVSAVDGTQSYTEPSRIKTVESIKVSDDELPLEKITMQELQRRYAIDSSEGVPVAYARHGGNLFVFPTPDDSYTLTVYYFAFHAASTTIEFEDRFREAVAARVTAMVARGLEMFDRANYWFEKYNEEVALLRYNADEDSPPAVTHYTDI